MKGKIEILRERLTAEFGYGVATIDRIFQETIGSVEPGRCLNCGGNILEQIFTFDCLDALLLLAMGREVREQARKGRGFTEANAVHVPSLDASLAVRCRTTMCSKLGLVAKLKKKNREGKEVQIPGTWAITSRGWAALRGERVPRKVVVWHGKIQERPDETTTLGEALRTHAEKLRRPSRAKEEAQNTAYEPAEWAEYGKEHRRCAK